MDLLQRLAPVSAVYATLPVRDAFNWQDASIGAGTAVGIALVLMSGLAVMKRRHSGLAV